ncbi:MAG: response regulator [Oscillospiraceae bacterium]|nr:response regulator [Oscillospiraceae bacterium]
MAKRVMVVDDSRVQEVQIRKLLEGSDYEVAHYCRSGEDALAVYDEVKPDVVTMDIIMPGMDGLEAAQAILEEYPEAKIVMVSSLAYDDTFNEAKAIGTKGFISKPVGQEELLAALDQALSGQ